jgi:LCP family protein required for cell wall assembly
MAETTKTNILNKADKQKKVKKPAKPKTPGGVFAKFFGIAFAVAIIVCTTGVTLGMHLLDSKPLVKEGTKLPPQIPQTDEKIDVLVPGEGIFATDYKNSKRVNVLLIGNTDEGLSDTIMLASFDPESKDIDIISVPRDTYYARPGYTSAGFLKINSVFHEGFYETALAVHNVLQGIPINYYAVLTYDGVTKIVDSMDGVPMYVPMDMHYTSAWQHLYIDLKKGQQTLDGDHAVQFLRFRKGYKNGDIGRVEAQQEFVKAAIKRALGLNLPKVADSIQENVESDIRVRTILYLLKESSGVEMSKVESFTLPGASGKINGLSFWVPAEPPEIETMLREVYDGQKATTEGAITTGGATTTGGAAAGSTGE